MMMLCSGSSSGGMPSGKVAAIDGDGFCDRHGTRWPHVCMECAILGKLWHGRSAAAHLSSAAAYLSRRQRRPQSVRKSVRSLAHTGALTRSCRGMRSHECALLVYPLLIPLLRRQLLSELGRWI
jgi:hypothetical protein